MVMTPVPTGLIPAWIDGRLQAADKMDVHRRGLRHPAVSVFVLRDDAVLIQQRAASKYHTPGLWTNTCCTHPHWGETAPDCAARRLDEELGLTGLDLRHAGVVEYRAAVPVADGPAMTEHEVVDIFTADAPAGLPLSLNPAEVQEVDWMTLEALEADILRRPDRYTPWLRIYLGQHRQLIFGDACSV
jgi:isopentenyl-diphosphate delta-isomerase